jgi:hypothetical protein
LAIRKGLESKRKMVEAAGIELDTEDANPADSKKDGP